METEPTNEQEQNQSSTSPEVPEEQQDKLKVVETEIVRNESQYPETSSTRETTPSSTDPNVIQSWILQSLSERVPEEHIDKLLSKSLDQYHERQKLIEENKYKVENNKYNVTRFSIGALIVMVIIVLGYAAFTKDKILADKVFTYIFGTGTGAGLATALNRRK